MYTACMGTEFERVLCSLSSIFLVDPPVPVYRTAKVQPLVPPLTPFFLKKIYQKFDFEFVIEHGSFGLVCLYVKLLIHMDWMKLSWIKSIVRTRSFLLEQIRINSKFPKLIVIIKGI